MRLHYVEKQETQKLHIHLNAVCGFVNKHTKNVQIITYSQNNRLYAPNNTQEEGSTKYCWDKLFYLLSE